MRLGPRALIAAICGAELLTMLGFSAFPALLPKLLGLWELSNTEAGWIAGIFFAGYTVAVPVLVGLTDRVDPKRIYMVGASLIVIGNLGFALFADGFWSALPFQLILGIGFAGTYMPGLKALQDQVGATHSRAVAFYTSTFGAGVAMSYAIADQLEALFGWQAIFWLAGASAFLGLLLVLVVLPWNPPKKPEEPQPALLDFRPVAANRSTLAFSLCYFVHSWELFGVRGWVVAFLAFTAAFHGVSDPILSPAWVAFALTLLGMPASIWGNELAMRYGRKKVVSVAMTLSAITCVAVGLSAYVSYGLAVMLCLLHGALLASESASVTAGALGNAKAGLRGSTMAFHSVLGFGGGFLGPLLFGAVLDLAGDGSPLGWTIAYAHMALVMLAGPVVIRWLQPNDLPGDGAPRPVGT